MAQPLDPVALHEAHGPGIEIRPHRLGTVAHLDLEQALGHLVQGFVPTDGGKSLTANALFTDAPQRLSEAIRVMDSLRIAGHLGADHTTGVVVVLGATNPADALGRQPFHFERASAGAIMRTGRMQDFGLCLAVEGHGGRTFPVRTFSSLGARA